MNGFHVGSETHGPSPHLSWAELNCHDAGRTPYPIEWRESRAIPLALEFETIREMCAEPIFVDSAYRTSAYNRAIGGAAASQHPQGRALDLRPSSLSVARFYMICLERSETPGSLLRGLGAYPTFVHIDIRPALKLVRWNGKRLSNRLVAKEVDG